MRRLVTRCLPLVALSRMHGDRGAFEGLWATTRLFGVPVDRAGARNFAFGGPLGDALLFAMLTAPRGTP